jgi:hypothetical protein
MNMGGKLPKAWVQIHPLTKKAASLLIKEPGLGKDFSEEFTSKRNKTAVGQRFYFLEIPGARLRVPPVDHRSHRHQQAGGPEQPLPSQSGDVQAVINFVKSEILINYYFSEEEARTVVEKLNKNDVPGVAQSITQALKNTLNTMLLKNVSNKVKIIHETFPELYLENYPDQPEHFSFGGYAKKVGGWALNAGKGLMTKIIEKLTEKLSGSAYQEILNFLKARANELKQAQAEPQDGVTIQISWKNITGLSALRSVISSIKGNLSIPNLGDLAVPGLPTPEIQIKADKKFE